ncbi:MAG: tagatose 1,6-diphosphate aldolase [Anaerolineaceae bacterium]
MFTRSIGKIRGLQQCATPNGKFAILALDHRNNLRNLLHIQDQDPNADERMAAFKQDVVKALANTCSAFLLDPLYGAAQNIVSQTLPGSCGLLVALEETGYTGDPSARESQILPNWSAAKIKRMGGSAVKLLVYYHPESPAHTHIEDLICKVAGDCQKADMPFFLEVLSYSLDPLQKKLEGNERMEVILKSAEKLTPLGADVLKAEFPLDINVEKNFNNWEAACKELTMKSTIPWILLSASVDFEIFLQQVKAASMAGSAGVAAGRAVWKEAADLSGHDRTNFLQNVASKRMRTLTELVDIQAAPWFAGLEPTPIDKEWFKTYPEK